jgi:two-component system, cell cycle sensor histidine kinase and response regulator CckA
MPSCPSQEGCASFFCFVPAYRLKFGIKQTCLVEKRAGGRLSRDVKGAMVVPNPISDASPEKNNSENGLSKLRAAQVRQLYSHVLPGMYGALVASAVMTAAFWNVVPHAWLFTWFVGFVIVQIPRHILVSTFRKASLDDTGTIRFGRWFALGSAATALLWGASAVVLFPGHSLLHQFMLAVFLAGVAASTAVIQSPLPECYLPSILLVLTPVSARYIYHGGEIDLAIGVAAIIFAIALIGAAYATNHALTESLTLRIERDDLIGSLRTVQNQLELRVQKRTSELLKANDLLENEILEREMKERELREYRLLVDNASEGIFVAQDGRFVFVNPACIPLTGQSREELLSQPFIEFIHPEDRDLVFQNYSKRLRGEDAPYGYSFRINTNDGELKWVHLNAVVIDWKGTPGVLALITDITQQKSSEDALNESERFLSDVFASIQDGISILDRDLNIVRVNPAMEKWYSHAMPLAGKKCFEAYQDTVNPCESCPTIQTLQSGLPAHEVVPKREPGREILGWLDLYSFPLVEKATGQLRGVIEYVRDITESKRSEEALRESEMRLRLAWETSPDAFSISRLKDGVYVDVNKGFSQLTGYSRDELLGRSALEIPIWYDISDRERLVSGLRENGYVQNLETRFRLKNGGIVTVLISAGKMMLDGEKHLLAITKDIEALKQAQEAVARSEEIFRKYFELGLVGMALTSPDKGWRYVNDRICEMLGYTREELLQTTWQDLTHPHDLGTDLAQFARLLSGEIDGYSLDKRFIHKDGSVVHTTLHASCIRRPDGTVEHVIAHLHDITERKRLEDKLGQAAKMEAIGQLAGGIAHDFNNILTAIMGYSEILIQQMPEDSPYRSKVVQVNRAGARAANLTRQLLAFSRKQILDLRPLDLNETIMNFDNMLRPIIGEDIDLVTSLKPSVGKVMGDAGQIEQILLNLAVNARDAMPNGGKLTIETGDAFLDQEYAQNHAEVQAGPYVMLAISDTGHGMDTQTMSRIFDPFFTTKSRDKGTGLGLSTVYGIVKQHQGHLSVYSEPDRGTTFKVYLPIIQEPTERIMPAPVVQTRLLGTETVLVVEDEDMVRKLTSEILEALGYTVLQSRDPEEAKKMSENHDGPIHLLLTDVVLPQMDGKSLFVLLSPMFPEMRVLYVSGYTENAVVHHGVLDAGVKFLQKPFTVDDLARKVRLVLDEV